MVLDEFEDERLQLVPVGRLAFGNRDEVFAEEDVGDALEFEQIFGEGGDFVGVLERGDVDWVGSAHDQLVGGHELVEVGIGRFVRVDEERIQNAS